MSDRGALSRQEAALGSNCSLGIANYGHQVQICVLNLLEQPAQFFVSHQSNNEDPMSQIIHFRQIGSLAEIDTNKSCLLIGELD